MSDVDIFRAGDGILARNIGLLDSVSKLPLFGFIQTSSTTYGTLWSGPVPIYPWQDAAGGLEVLSSDADDSVAGPGLRLGQVDVLDGDWNRFTIRFAMAGTTPVDLAALMPDESTKTVRRVMCERVLLVGATRGSNKGDITFRRPGPGDVLGFIEPGRARGRTAQFSTAIDEFAYIPMADFFIQGSRNADVKLLVNVASNITSLTTPGGVVPGFGPRVDAIEIIDQVAELQVGNGITWLEIPPASDVEIQARKNSGGGGTTDIQMTTTAYIKKVAV